VTSTPHISPEPAALVELATAVGQWLGAESAPDDVIRTQERVVEWAARLEEQLETAHETVRRYVVEISRAPGNRDQDAIDAASQALVALVSSPASRRENES
jgi:hypothetical protein